MFKRSILLFLFCGIAAVAQVPPISNELSPQFRADLNTSLTLAVSTGGSYNNPAWITALAWAKITGVPSFLVAGNNLSDLASISAARTNLGLGALSTAGYPSAGLFKSTGSAFSPAVIGDIPTGYPYGNLASPPAIPAASSATPLMDSTGAAGSATTFARADHVHPSDTSKQNTITSAPGAWPTSFPPLVPTTAAGVPAGSCTPFSTVNVPLYGDSTAHALWWCDTTGAWQRILSVAPGASFLLSGLTSTSPGTAAASSLNAYFDSTSNTLIAIDSSSNTSTTVRGASATANQFLANVDALGVQHTRVIAAADLPDVPTLTSTSGPVADPGGASYYQYNNASGALTFTLPAGVAGMQRVYRNATGKTGVITIAVTTSNSIDLAGVNGTTSSGTLVSGGALGDEVTLRCDVANHWYADAPKGTWVNN